MLGTGVHEDSVTQEVVRRSPVSKTHTVCPSQDLPSSCSPGGAPRFQAQGPESLNIKTIIAPQSEVHGLPKETHFGVSHPRPPESEALGVGVRNLLAAQVFWLPSQVRKDCKGPLQDSGHSSSPLPKGALRIQSQRVWGCHTKACLSQIRWKLQAS